MAETKIDIGLDASSAIKSLNDLSEETKSLAVDVEKNLGQGAAASIKKLQLAAEDGSSKITNFFSNMGKRVREDLKTAFDATGVVAGAKFAQEMALGIKSVFDMERAFDRLNTRLQLTGKGFLDFKKNIGQAAANNGQKLEDILPGVETAASKGGVRDPKMLANIANVLAQSKATTGEGTEGTADRLVDILQAQGKAVTDKTMKDTMDAVQATRVTGAFKTSGDAADAIKNLSQNQQLHMSTREFGGLAATASHTAGGLGMLQDLAKMGNSASGRDQLNGILGPIFSKDGKIDRKALANVNTDQFGKYSQEAFSAATGLQGASSSDFARFIKAFKENDKDFSQVVNGMNETQTQFDMATDNFASTMDRFRQKTVEATREIGEGLSTAASGLIHGNFTKAGAGLASAATAANDNRGTIAAAVGVTALMATLGGGGLNSLLKKVPGGGALGKMATGKAMGLAGVNSVYVVNADEIASKSGSSYMEKMAAAMGAKGALPGLGGKILGGAGMVGGGVAAGIMGYEAGTAAYENNFLGTKTISNALTDTLADFFLDDDQTAMNKGAKMAQDSRAAAGMAPIDPKVIADAVREGASQARVQMTGPQINPSDISFRGGKM